MSKQNSSSSGGISFSSLLLLTFIVLKLCKVIDWSWWWVFSPVWIGISLVLVVAFIVVLVKALK